jgi:hypothetical protein
MSTHGICAVEVEARLGPPPEHSIVTNDCLGVNFSGMKEKDFHELIGGG